MFLHIVLLLTAVLIAVDGAPLDAKASPEVIRYEYEHLPDNAYRYVYELSDGQFKDEHGSFRQVGDQQVLVVTGSYSWKDQDGKEYRVRYTSDENGFRASGDHLPNTNTDILAPPAPQFVSSALIATLVG